MLKSSFFNRRVTFGGCCWRWWNSRVKSWNALNYALIKTMNQQIENIFTVRVLHLEDSLIRFEVKNEMHGKKWRYKILSVSKDRNTVTIRWKTQRDNQGWKQKWIKTAFLLENHKNINGNIDLPLKRSSFW